MRLTKDAKAKLKRDIIGDAYPSHLFFEAGDPVVDYLEKTLPFQEAVTVLKTYPSYVKREDSVKFVVKYTGYRYVFFREAYVSTSMPYAARIGNDGYFSAGQPITFSIDGDEVTLVGFYDKETVLHPDDKAYEIGAPMFDLMRERIAFEEAIEKTLSSTDSLGKLLSLIPYLQTMFPEEKIINVSETEKKLTTPEELAFINRRLELVRNGEIR